MNSGGRLNECYNGANAVGETAVSETGSIDLQVSLDYE